MLMINPKVKFEHKPTAIDVETDEKDGFVGIGLCQGTDQYYFSELTQSLSLFLTEVPLIGHNLKFDMRELIQWGVPLQTSQLYFDTCLAAYVQNSTKDSLGLKDLAREILNMEWTTYTELVGKGKNKLTLDKHPIQEVAAYCGNDVLATYKLYEHYSLALTETEKQLLVGLEIPTAKALLALELRGIKVDLDYLKTVQEQLKIDLAFESLHINDVWLKHNTTKLNINSNRQIGQLLELEGATLPLTKTGEKQVNKTVISKLQLPVVRHLLKYSELEKLYSTYAIPLQEQAVNSKIHCTFNQVSRDTRGSNSGIATTRLSSSKPNLQNIPIRSENGKLIRKAFIPNNTDVIIDADFSQIEYRLLAHFTQEPELISAFKDNVDVHLRTGQLLGVSRDIGKLLNFGAIYGAGEQKVAEMAKVTEQEAKQFLSAYWRNLPAVQGWITRLKWQAKRDKFITTMLGRRIPLPGINSLAYREQKHWERAAVNYVIQGSAAEIMKLGLIRLEEKGFEPLLTVHDEYLFSIEPYLADERAEEIKLLLESLVTLSVPLVVDIGIGPNWGEAKH